MEVPLHFDSAENTVQLKTYYFCDNVFVFTFVSVPTFQFHTCSFGAGIEDYLLYIGSN
jgi:hypothetical protein